MNQFNKYKLFSILALALSATSIVFCLFNKDFFGGRTDNIWRKYSDNAYFGGNVGINTTDPNQKLTLNSGNIATEITSPTITVSTTTGTSYLATSTYYFKLAVTDGANGTSTPSAESYKAVTATTTALNITWTAVAGADKYILYWATSTGAQTKYFVATTTNSYTFATTTSYLSGTLPTTNTAYTNKISYTGNSWIKASNFGVATSAPTAMLSVGNTGTTTIDFGRFCIRSINSAGTSYYLYLTTNGSWATSSASCF